MTSTYNAYAIPVAYDLIICVREIWKHRVGTYWIADMEDICRYLHP